MDGKIKKYFLDATEKHPFSSGEFYSFFKYSRHRNFRNFLDNPKYYKYLIFDKFDLINKRNATTIHFNREMFLLICKKNKINSVVYDDYYLIYNKLKIDNNTSDFINIKKDDRNHNLKLYFRPAGKYYNHSLNTINLASAIKTCPFDLFRFCSEKLRFNLNPMGKGFSNEYNRDSFETHKPYYHFDSKIYQERGEYLHLINEVIKDYTLDVRQLQLAKYYYEKVKEMLFKQIAIEHKKHTYAEKTRKRKEKGNLIKHTSKQMKLLYRKAAKMFHPDKNPKDLETFKKVNQYYRENNYSDLLKLVESK